MGFLVKYRSPLERIYYKEGKSLYRKPSRLNEGRVKEEKKEYSQACVW